MKEIMDALFGIKVYLLTYSTILADQILNTLLSVTELGKIADLYNQFLNWSVPAPQNLRT